MTPTRAIVLAAVAHPDDVEFMVAGTLLLLKEAGADIHIWNLANGCLGSIRTGREETAKIRWAEALASARLCGATLHPPLFDDMEIVYDSAGLARASAVVRLIRPTLILTHALSDYMEDHQNAAKLVASAAFVRSARNYVTQPPCDPYDDHVVIYHAMPHGLQGPLGETPLPSHFVEIDDVYSMKRDMLAKHPSQMEWLDFSQGMDSYLKVMETNSFALGRMSGRFTMAEGFTVRSSLGFAPPGLDPLSKLLGDRVLRATHPA